MSSPTVTARQSSLIRLCPPVPVLVGEATELEAFIRHERLIAAGAEIASEGDPDGHVAVLMEGMAGRYKMLRTGGRQIVAVCLPGDFLTLRGYLPARMDHSIIALSSCAIGTAGKGELDRIFADNPALMRLFWRSSMAEAAISREWLVSVGRRNALERTAHLLCELQYRLAAAGLCRGNWFQLPLTQTDIGDIVGLSAVHTNRTIQELRSRGLVAWTHGTVHLRDLAALRELAGFDPGYLDLD